MGGWECEGLLLTSDRGKELNTLRPLATRGQHNAFIEDAHSLGMERLGAVWFSSHWHFLKDLMVRGLSRRAKSRKVPSMIMECESLYVTLYIELGWIISVGCKRCVRRGDPSRLYS